MEIVGSSALHSGGREQAPRPAHARFHPGRAIQQQRSRPPSAATSSASSGIRRRRPVSSSAHRVSSPRDELFLVSQSESGRIFHARYQEVAPRATPRIGAPASMPRPTMSSMRELDGRSFGALSSSSPVPSLRQRPSEGPTVLRSGVSQYRFQGVVADDYFDAIPRRMRDGGFGAHASGLTLRPKR
jgi:hypothetical protein